MQPIEIFGYLAMLVVLYSMTMKDIRSLRYVNSIACAMFVVYGIIIGSYPVTIMNIVVILINLYQNYKSR
jgi:uncharacterized protein with PQ loop repeat